MSCVGPADEQNLILYILLTLLIRVQAFDMAVPISSCQHWLFFLILAHVVLYARAFDNSRSDNVGELSLL